MTMKYGSFIVVNKNTNKYTEVKWKKYIIYIMFEYTCFDFNNSFYVNIRSNWFFYTILLARNIYTDLLWKDLLMCLIFVDINTIHFRHNFLHFMSCATLAQEKFIIPFLCLQSMERGDPAWIGYIYSFLIFVGVVWFLSRTLSGIIIWIQFKELSWAGPVVVLILTT